MADKQPTLKDRIQNAVNHADSGADGRGKKNGVKSDSQTTEAAGADAMTAKHQ